MEPEEECVIRWLSLVGTLVAVAWGQSSHHGSLVAKTSSEVTDVNLVSPGSVNPEQVGSVPALPGMPPLPTGKVTLIGGTIHSIDPVRDQMVVQIFAGHRMTVLFDERTRMYRDGKAASPADLKKGERAYMDTTLDGKDIFARSIRVASASPSGQSSGQIVAFDRATGELTLRDTLSPEPVTMQVASDATILSGDRTAAPAELRSGALVALTFDPRPSKRPTVRQISILASPGTTFVFVGRIEHLDFRRGLLVLVDPRDNKNYDLYFDASTRGVNRGLKQGASVTVKANFDGTRYQTREIDSSSVTAE